MLGILHSEVSLPTDGIQQPATLTERVAPGTITNSESAAQEFIAGNHIKSENNLAVTFNVF